MKRMKGIVGILLSAILAFSGVSLSSFQKITRIVSGENEPAVEYESIYSTGFENFTAATTYNNTTAKVYPLSENEKSGWSVVFGTVSTNSAISGSNSMHMRVYSSTTSGVPCAYTTTSFDNVSKISFKYAVSNTTIHFNVQYSTDGSSWTTIESVSPSGTSASTYSKEFDEPIDNFTFRIQTTFSSTPSKNNWTFRIDDVEFFKEHVATPLDAPTNLAVDNDAISWSNVEHASSYNIGIRSTDGIIFANYQNVETNSKQVEIPYGLSGEVSYKAFVKANGDGYYYSDSSEASIDLCEKSSFISMFYDGAQYNKYVTDLDNFDVCVDNNSCFDSEGENLAILEDVIGMVFPNKVFKIVIKSSELNEGLTLYANGIDPENVIDPIVEKNESVCYATYNIDSGTKSVYLESLDKSVPSIFESITSYYKVVADTVYPISYVLNGGTNNVNNPSEYDSTIGVAQFYEPTRSRYDFEGWYLSSDFSGDKITSIAVGLYNSSITLYAKWVYSAHSLFEDLTTRTALLVDYNTVSVPYTEYVEEEPLQYSFNNTTDENVYLDTVAVSSNISLAFDIGTNSTYAPMIGIGSNSSYLRFYNGNTMTVSISNNYTLKEITFNYSGTDEANRLSESDFGDYGESYSKDNCELSLASNGIYSLTITNTASKQKKISSMSFVIGKNVQRSRTGYTYNSVDIKIGIGGEQFTSEIKSKLDNEAKKNGVDIENEKPVINNKYYYGVAVCLGETFNAETAYYSDASTSGSTKYYSPVQEVNDDKGINGYTFSMQLKNVKDYGQKIIAKAFVCINGTKYYAQASTANSVNTMAKYYVEHSSDYDGITPYLGMLADLSTATYTSSSN